ncbi:MAG TPA: response regulator transcription factor [Chloroflexia bacterium]|nr:response regulator transcription factor [Chloroflexia bacterium]
MIRVFLVAPTPMLRAGMRTLLTTPAMAVVGEGTAVGHWQGSEADVIIVSDEELVLAPDREAWGERLPALVVMSLEGRAAATLRALPLPSWALVAPDASADELQAAVLAAGQGLVALPAGWVPRLLGGRAAVEVLDLQPNDEPLTAREQEVLELLGRGLSNKLIARRLGISEHTVKFHVSSIYGKLGAASRTEAVSRGAHRGLITL